MADAGFVAYFDADTSTLELGGTIDPAALPLLQEELDRAFRRTAFVLTLDLTRVEQVPAHALGKLVHLCNTRYPGTLLRGPATPATARSATPPRATPARAIA